MYKTQAEEVLEVLKSGRKLTQFEALYELGIMRLASRVSDLNKARREGDKNIPFIYKRMKRIECSNGRIAHVAEYYVVTEEA